jgi:glutathione synthase
MKMGFIMDPIELLNINADTTFALMLAAQEAGHELYYIKMQELEAHTSRVYAPMARCAVRRVAGDHYTLEAWEVTALDALDVVWMRKDPPFDLHYLHAVQLLDLVEQRGVLVVNRPRGLERANEKLYTLQFEDYTPQTLITRSKKSILQFLHDMGGKCILKPVDGHGGAGVMMLDVADRNLHAIIEVSSRDGAEQVICQRYVPEARAGDKRILLLNGEPLGAILRIPREDDNRGNIHVGGRVAQATLTARDREIAAAVGERLREDGLWFVGIDVLGDYLTEVNVTSPTGIQEMSRLDGVDYAARTIAWAQGAARG